MHVHDHVTAQHAQHDLTLIAGLAADDLVTADRTRAQALLDSCSECSAIHDDLLAIARAARTLPAIQAPRDFRITAEQAARLRRTGWLARILGPFAAAGSVARPLAATFTSLGLVGVFVASSAAGMLGGAGSMAAPEAAGPAGAPGPVASAAPGAMFGPAATAGSDDQQVTKDDGGATADPLYGQAVGGADGRNSAVDGVDGQRVDQPRPGNPLLLGSLALLGAGLLLFGLRFAGRRLR